MDKSTTSAFTTYINLESPKSQNSKYHFSSMTTERPQIYGEQALGNRYQYINNNNLETLLNAIEVAPIELSSPKHQIVKQNIMIPSHLSTGNNEKQKLHFSYPLSPTITTSYHHRQLEECSNNNIISKEQIRAHRLLPPPNKSMSISSLIDSDQPIQSSSVPLTPPDSSLTLNFPELSITQTKLPIESIPFPRLQPSSNIFINSFPLPSVNQAIGDVDRTRNSPPPLISNNNKRKWEATENPFTNGLMSIDDKYVVEETRSKMRRSIEGRFTQNSAYPSSKTHCPRDNGISLNNHHNSNTYQMSTITCYHASVAQKSYGSEKRFLCPPPVVIFERHDNNCRGGGGGYHPKPSLSMSVVCETEEKLLEQKASLDENMKGTFKYLHVSGTAKAKQFTLKLKIFHNNSTIPHVEIDSSSVTIISKPSKKTAKARNVSSCILSGSLISLFNRINSQTVRTKYMGIEGGLLCAISSPSSPSLSSSNSPTVTSSDSTPITYGSEIILSDPTTGFVSDRLIIRKVEKSRIAQGACGPVSQMQKIALQRVHPGTREPHYLSAAGPITMDGPRSQEQCAVSGASPFLGYQTSKIVHIQNTEFTKEPFRMASMQSSILSNKSDTSNSAVIEEVDDYLCWTIVGISKFQIKYPESMPSTPNTPTQ
ncbi:5347_t:CDS:2 [Acaulospora morrowiae]|uniref:5347_t:CDS:1 n=1 Tax=Acaulospora morrowiae TaxID=94023 RepID=A0A9N9FSI7_9GLOM|nr:5347_t:CDS:2 [Acaulospora morrowiae]